MASKLRSKDTHEATEVTRKEKKKVNNNYKITNIMSRCTNKTNLEIHHKRVDGGNGIENAEVLCKKCHANTSTFCTSGHTPPPPFSEITKSLALLRAGNRCECTRTICGFH